eukprot:CAMPEP_0197635852 /NCGR_PEP_ID=MMETSP1338-20131121/11549_1 /TAXON_ID=43686 ORGANISM="Pelagodinium beii, Strain RCC1491" /NCGR_SAMPLE_ID=MMETSP1338 /ASSEMBLY_ACC=CAM_ASM_000754 /LENGTH=159 /DNA_ID=CAMNT_0043207979 /DNA_START=37 /DNA_END=512 /DNA_ORIENTATION=-
MVEPKQRTAKDVLEGLRAYMEDDDFLLDISCWAWEYSQKFPYEPVSRWEHPLEFTKLHNEYRELFEGRVDEFLEQEGVNIKHVLDDVAQEMKDNPGETRALIDSLAASEDYLAFCKYMQQVRIRRDWAEGRESIPVSDDSETIQAPSGLEKVPEEPATL